MHRLLVFLLLAGCLGDTCTPYAEVATREGGAGLGANEQGCIEQRTRVSAGSVTELGPVDELLERVVGTRASTLTWVNFVRTIVTVKVSDPQVYFVRSRADRASQPADGWCANRLEVVATVLLSTQDERLDETIQGAVLTAYSTDDARGLLTIERGYLDGTYEAVVRTQHCFQKLEIRLLFASDGMHGSLVDLLTPGNCDDEVTGKLIPYASGHWGSRWTNY